MRFFKILLMVLLVALSVGCTADMDIADGDIKPPVQGKPTVPLKKRPIVPTSKLPRPRVASVAINAEGGLVVSMAESVDIATVTITEHDTGMVTTYVVDSEVFELNDISESAFDVAVEADGEVDVYTVME